MQIKGIVLETNEGVYEGRNWKSLIARVQDRLMKFKVDKEVDLSNVKDREVTMELEIVGSASQSAYVKVVSVN